MMIFALLLVGITICLIFAMPRIRRRLLLIIVLISFGTVGGCLAGTDETIL